MNCCDEYGNCRQGRDCPVRKERYIPPVKMWTIWTAGVLLVCVWVGVIALHIWVSASTKPSTRKVDCSLASFHPDYTAKDREMCRMRGNETRGEGQ